MGKNIKSILEGEEDENNLIDAKKSKEQKFFKCCLCGKNFKKEELVVKNNKKYCPDCLIIRDAEAKIKAKDWDLLFKYICELYDISVPTGMMFVQLKQYRNEYNYTDIGMYYTLKYFYDILENEIKEDTGLGIIPYYYDKARKHYNKVFDIEDKADDFNNNEQLIKIKTKMIDKPLDIKKPLPLKIDWQVENEND